MYFRKLFALDSKPARVHRESSYLQGRGRYPERRDEYEDHFAYRHSRSESGYEPVLDELAGYGQPEYTPDRYNRRRMPLTTLDALLQIKANGLAHDNGYQ